MYPPRWLMVAGFALVAVLPCAGQEKAGQEAKAPLRYTELLYPIGPGYRWHYRVTDQKAPKGDADTKKPQTVLVAVERQQTFRLNSEGKIGGKAEGAAVPVDVVGYELVVQHLQPSGEKKIMREQVLIAEDGVYRISGGGKTINPPLQILKKDARKGAAWMVESQSENAEIKGSFVADEEIVEVPAAKFRTVVIRSQGFQVGEQKMQLTAWYAPDVGMVKQHVQIGNHDMLLELEKFEKGK